MARSLWYVAPGKVALQTEPIDRPGLGEALVRSLYSGVSRGTERLVLAGEVPGSEWQRMRAPHQAGQFPFPVKYGYCAVGRVETGPKELEGRTVFAFYPHQDVFVLPVSMLTLIPERVPARRATLAANMETALNALWDAEAGPGDRIAVVGGGIVGLLVTTLAARMPGAEVTLIDINSGRADLAESLGARFALPEAAETGADVVFHASSTAAGLETAIRIAGFEATVVEMSWYGDQSVPVHLGGAFHSQRLRLISTQVGQVAPARRARWTHGRRLEAALRLLDDPRLDALVDGEIAFEDAPAALPAILSDRRGLAPVIRYGPLEPISTAPRLSAMKRQSPA